MKLLVVRAHPLDSSKSRSLQMADAFVAGFRETHPDSMVQDVNLYSVAVPELDLDLLSGWGALREGEHFSHLSAMQQAKLTLFATSSSSVSPRTITRASPSRTATTGGRGT